MTPAQLRALLDAATKRPWKKNGSCIQASPIGDVATVRATGDRPWAENTVAIVATMNAADVLVALWEAAYVLATQPLLNSTKPLVDALRRLEELQ